MAASRIYPEKVTNPFQLMAAWFVMLILVDGSFIAGASQIKNPIWISGFLCISSVVLAIIVVIVVFLMLTKYRPHLQSSKEYAIWLRDTQRYAIRKLDKQVKKTATTKSVKDISKKLTSEPTITLQNVEFSLFKQISSTAVEVANIEGSDEVVGALRGLGFHAELYQGTRTQKYSDEVLENHEAIWVGYRVPALVAVLAIKNVLKYWSHLKYIDLSDESAPDYVQSEIFFGGATSTAKSDGLQEWSQEELLGIDNNISTQEFHKLIKSKYTKTDHI
jgi:hypothetical protein